MIDQIEPSTQDTAQEFRQWRNLYFTRSGRTYWSWWTFATEAECRRSSQDWFKLVAVNIAKNDQYGDYFADLWNSTDLVIVNDILFAVPMLWVTPS
jgi:hypothetical protein